MEEDLDTRFRSVLANNDPDAIAWLLQQDGCLLGLADSGAHVSQLCDACLPTDLLGNWVRDKDVISLEHAVHKLTGEPAAVFGLDAADGGRGRIEVGMAADITVFDPATVAPGPLRRIRDFPADGERLTADRPVGMRHTLVNGVPDPGRRRSGRRGPRPDAGHGAPQLTARALPPAGTPAAAAAAPGRRSSSVVAHHRLQRRRAREPRRSPAAPTKTRVGPDDQQRHVPRPRTRAATRDTARRGRPTAPCAAA